MAFTEETAEFLVVNRLTDSKLWFHEHKEDYLRLVKNPLTALCEALAPCIAEIDPMLVTQPSRCISRIYRDTRFSHDKTIFRDHMWISFDRDHKEYPEAPGFYFSIGPGYWHYGCGFYEALPKVLEAVREMILARDPDAVAAMQAYAAQDEFKLYGNKYKRSRFPDESEEMRDWLDRRDLGFGCEREDVSLLENDDDFIPVIEAGYKALVPMYEFMMKAVHRARAGF